MKKILIALALIGITRPAFAGPGHDHGESAFASTSGPAIKFQLTEQQMDNLDVRARKVELIPIQNTVDMLAFTELLPEKRAIISPRFGGKILKIHITVGQEIKKDQKLVTLDPLNVGNRNIVLFAPIDGFVVSLSAGMGEIIEPGGTIMEIGDATQMLVRGVAYETPDINKIKVGQIAEIHLDIDPDRHLLGKIQRINRVIDPESRTFSVYALIDTPRRDIQHGLQGTMEVLTGNEKPVIAVPKRSLLGELGSHFVYVLKGREIEKRDVTIGAKTGHHTEVKSGLSPNEHVVTNGNYQLQFISLNGVYNHDNHHKEDEHDHSHDEDHGDHSHKEDEHDHSHDEDHGDHSHEEDEHDHSHDEDHRDHSHEEDEHDHRHDEDHEDHSHDKKHEHDNDHEH